MHKQGDLSGAPDMRVAAAIRDYLAKRPGAADSLQGITQWWLSDLDPPPSMDDVRAALEWLARAGIVEQVGVTGSGGLWRTADGCSGNEEVD